MIEKVIHVGEIRVHPAMLEARSEDTPAGYVHATLTFAVEDRTTDAKGKTSVEVFNTVDENFKKDHISTNPRVLELANEMRDLIAQEVADERACQVRASTAKAAAYIQPT